MINPSILSRIILDRYDHFCDHFIYISIEDVICLYIESSYWQSLRSSCTNIVNIPCIWYLHKEIWSKMKFHTKYFMLDLIASKLESIWHQPKILSLYDIKIISQENCMVHFRRTLFKFAVTTNHTLKTCSRFQFQHYALEDREQHKVIYVFPSFVFFLLKGQK